MSRDNKNENNCSEESLEKELQTVLQIMKKQKDSGQYRAILGLDEDCSGEKKIKNAYRKLMLRYHPDRCGNSDIATEIAKIINQAVKKISDGIDLDELYAHVEAAENVLFSINQSLDERNRKLDTQEETTDHADCMIEEFFRNSPQFNANNS